jgi:hypothetical protein
MWIPGVVALGWCKSFEENMKQGIMWSVWSSLQQSGPARGKILKTPSDPLKKNPTPMPKKTSANEKNRLDAGTQSPEPHQDFVFPRLPERRLIGMKRP